jgi:hypothetical protein
MDAASMPTGSCIWGYKIVKAKNGSSDEAAFGARSFLYFDGNHVSDDEVVIDFPTATKLPAVPGSGQDYIWLQEPGGQKLTDEQVDEIIASGAEYRLD